MSKKNWKKSAINYHIRRILQDTPQPDDILFLKRHFGNEYAKIKIKGVRVG